MSKFNQKLWPFDLSPTMSHPTCPKNHTTPKQNVQRLGGKPGGDQLSLHLGVHQGQLLLGEDEEVLLPRGTSALLAGCV